MAIPLGDSADGGKNYLTGLGLMHEDPVATLFGGLNDSQAFARNLLAKSNPMIKGFAEWGLGRSSFQGGPLGGRDLHDMDPTLGRIITQVGLQEENVSGQAAPAFGSRALEFGLANSPVSRLLTTTKNLLDSRKSVAERIANVTTGLKITTVSPEQSRRAVRDISDSIARDVGARPFSTFTVSDDLLEYAQQNHPEAYKRLAASAEIRRRWNIEDKKKKALQRVNAAE